MNCEIRERIIANCFNAWVTKDELAFESLLAVNAIYIESWGPAYRGSEILKWFKEWNKKNSVLQWSISKFLHQDNSCVCQWIFKFKNDGGLHEIDGISVIEFNHENKIIYLKEYQSKIPNFYPYENV